MLLFIGMSLLIFFAPLPQPVQIPKDRLIRIEASSFQFTPGEIQINPGDRVTVELVSTDVVHGFSLDGYSFELKADPGKQQRAPLSQIRQGSSVFAVRWLAATCTPL